MNTHTDYKHVRNSFVAAVIIVALSSIFVRTTAQITPYSTFDETLLFQEEFDVDELELLFIEDEEFSELALKQKQNTQIEMQHLTSQAVVETAKLAIKNAEDTSTTAVHAAAPQPSLSLFQTIIQELVRWVL